MCGMPLLQCGVDRITEVMLVDKSFIFIGEVKFRCIFMAKTNGQVLPGKQFNHDGG